MQEVIRVSASIWDSKGWLGAIEHFKPSPKGWKWSPLAHTHSTCTPAFTGTICTTTGRLRVGDASYPPWLPRSTRMHGLRTATDVSLNFESLVCVFIPPPTPTPVLRNGSQVATPWCKLHGKPGDGVMMPLALLWKHLHGTEVQLSMKWYTNLQSSQCNLEFIFFSMCMQLWR